MELLTRADLIEMDEETLLGTAECHGVEVEGRTVDEVFQEFADQLDTFASLAGGGL